MTLLGAMLMAMLYIIYLALWPFPVINYTHVPMHVLTHTLRPGDMLSYELSYCKPEGVGPISISRQLVNDVVIELPEITDSMEDGCHTMTITRDQIPEFAPPGQYRLRQVVSFHVSPLQHRIVVIDTESFTVVQ